MLLIGIFVTLLGFLISLVSLSVSSSVEGRMVIALTGIAVSVFGVIRVLNGHFLKNALWRK